MSLDWWTYPRKQNAFKRLPAITSTLNAVFALPGTDKVWAVGSGGMIVHSEDSGRTWVQQEIRPASAQSPSAADKGAFLELPQLTSNAYAATPTDTKQQHVPLKRQPPANTTNALDKQLTAQQESVPAKGGNEPASSETIKEETARLLSSLEDSIVGASLYGVHFISAEEGWIVGDGGTILHTTDGGQSWTPQTSGVPTGRFALIMLPNGRQGWIVGSNLLGSSGIILHTTDGGQTWTPQSGGSTTWLSSIAMLSDGRHGWIVGSGGTILQTTDGGQAWTPPFYQVRFAPWYYLLGWLVPLTLCALAFVYFSAQPPPEEQSVADNLVSDRPLEAGDPDPLGFTTIALGLSRFLRNDKTQPPLTVAITGEWGSGKSSLMNLLKADLAQRGFRPVWFNAWHHQQEEQLLAALLQSIRLQSVPAVWHPHGLLFRVKLLLLRGRRYLWLFIPALLAFAFSVGYLIAHPQTPSDAFAQLQQWLQTLTGWGKLLSPDSPPATSSSDQPSLLTFIVTLFAALPVLRKGLTAFGVNPATLLASVSENARVRDLGAQVSFRQKFAAEFRDVTKALQPRTMLILIDDLDRCRPEKVLEVLEAINFLVSSGECYVVMSMALERVERCVGLGFKDVAEELLDDQPQATASDEKKEEGKRKRAVFARQYLEKLINIEVPVPTLTNDQSAQLLSTNAHTPVEKNGQHWQNLFTLARLRQLTPWTVFVFALVYSFWFGFRIENAPKPTITTAAPTPTTGSQQAPTPKTEEASQLPKDKEPATNVAVFIPGQQSHPSPWLPLAPLGLVLAAWVWLTLRDQQEVVVKDSPEFVDALKIWLPLITAKQNTPRSVKRFLNKVRYLAMRQRPQEETARTAVAAQTNGKPDEDGTPMPESTLVALSAMQHCYPEKLNDQNFFLKLNDLQKDERIVRKENGYQNPMRLNKALEEHEKKFTASLEFQSHWNKFVEISKGVRVS